MKILRKSCVIITALALFVYVPYFNSVSAVSENVLRLNDETEKFVSLTIDCTLKDYPEGLPELIKALNKDQLNVVESLFSLPTITNDVNKITLSSSIEGVDLLVAAIGTGDLEFVKLIDKYFNISDFINETDSCGFGTPLWNAVLLADSYRPVNEKKAKDMVDYLLSLGADPYNEDGKGYIPYLFEMGKASESRMYLKEVFEKYGYFFI